ncbi:MAG: hypothetical protein QOF37_1515 [Thermoleophilaceae bacterium]|nr:hypothetical protein [Thermoleophilaceae bacterium]
MSVAPLLQVEASFFRRQMPDLLLREGSTLAARVAEREGKHGIITLGGMPLLAELPDGVKTGDTLTLLVADTRGDKVVMRLIQDHAAEQTPNPTLNLIQPDGSQARLTVDEDGSQDGEGGRDRQQAGVSLTYETPKLGAVGLRVEITPGQVRVRAEVRAGRVYDLADDASDELRSRLSAITGRAAEVTVVARRDRIDAYA